MSRFIPGTAQLAEAAAVDRIRDAVARGGLVLHAQPVVEVLTGRIVRRELLVRMLSPSNDVLPPATFLPLAERSGVITAIDRWVITEALAVAATGTAVQLNLSGASVGEPGMAEHVERELELSGAEPRDVVFELTETVPPPDPLAAGAFLRRVRALGCSVALDDFGTGFAALANVKRFAVDFLKVDVDFVRDLPYSDASRHVVRAIVDLARAFGLQTIAEGVEEPEAMAVLAELGVDFAQGFAIGRPAPLVLAARF